MAEARKTIQADLSKPNGAHVTLEDGPNSARVGVAADKFVAANDEGVTLSPGPGGNVNIQAMPDRLVFGGLVRPTGFAFGMIPSTVATPIPQYRLAPPLDGLMDIVREMSALSASFLG